jgi:hypothetical protein
MLTAAVLLLSTLGLGLAVWWQLRGVGENKAAFARRRKQAGFGLLLLMLMLGAASYITMNGVPDRIFAAEEDGDWGALAIDGRSVSADDYRIWVDGGRLAGGRDGCNDWGYSDDPPYPDGSRMILSTMVGCPDDPVRKAYWALRASGTRLELRTDGSLRLAGQGHEAIFRRCNWVQERSPGHGGSGQKICDTHDPDRLVNF